jgi:hypothetical protein
MRHQQWLCFAMLLCACAAPAVASNVAIAPDRMLEVDGQRTFILGLYENPKDDAVLDSVARAGFNLIRASENKAVLDRLHARGLYAWLNTGGRIDLSEEREAREARLREMVDSWGFHPALLVWEVPDEALWGCWLNAYHGNFPTFSEMYVAFRANVNRLCPGMVAGYQVLKKLDPNHPVWINHAAGNTVEDLAEFNRGADIAGCDIYPLLPFPTHPIDLSRKMLGLVGTSTFRMQLAAPGKPMWMVLQGAGWVDFDGLFGPKDPAGQRPTFEESRFMAYDAIARGARAILYWGTHYVDKDSQLWLDILKLVRELADLQPVLSAPDVSAPVTIESAALLGFYKDSVQVLGKQTDAGVIWFIVNEAPVPSFYTIQGLAQLNGAKYTDTLTGQEHTINDGLMKSSIPGLTVQILKPVALPIS